MKQSFKMPTGETVQREMPVWKTPYNHDTNFESERTALYTPEESLTKQEFAQEADINVLIARVLKTGELPEMALPEHFMDMSKRTTYYDMATRVAEANELFYQLPATTRSEYLNDPNRWAEAVVQATEAGNVATLQKLGIQASLVEEPQAPPKGTPPPADTPAPKAAQEASGDSKKGETPKPPSDKEK